MRHGIPIVLLLLGLAVIPVHAETPVTLCDLITDPAAYDRKVVEIAAFVSHGFEDFTLFDPRCSDETPRVWVEYGGKFASGTIFCCGLGDQRSRAEPLIVEDIVTTIADDQRLLQFDRLVQREPDSVVRATLRGRFFAGEKRELPGGTFWVGYGHFGLFSLFVIEKVVFVEPQDLRHVDYRASADQPEITGVGCYSSHLGGTAYSEAIERQRQAEGGESPWMFSDPKRVAIEHLQSNLAGSGLPPVRVKSRAPGRMVYESVASALEKKYWVVVTRPYWLTFFARDRNRVAWIPIAAYESGCDKRSP